ncbi:MAG: hypothetical protein ABI646_02850 [Acidobacteriota bacterium]
MKKIFRFLGTGVLSAAIIAVGAVAGFGQDAPAATANANCADIDGHNALYTKFTGVYGKKTLPEMESALSTGKEYLEKFGSCEAFTEQVAFVKPHVTRLESAVRRTKLVARYDASVKADDPTEIVAAGKDFLALEPDNTNLLMPMALSSSYKSTKENNFKYSDDAIRYATTALGKIKGGWAFTKKDDKGAPVIGVFQYTFSKDAAIGELTYALAYSNYYGKKDKKTALPLYYELSQSSSYKSDPRVYGTIGDYYIEEGAPIGDEIAKFIADIKAATDEKVKADLDAKVKEKIAMFNGYTERALDAYSRAYNVAKAGPYKDNLYKVMQGLYKRRFDKDMGLDAFVSTTLVKPFPNPTTPVTPVSDPEPTTTTGTAAPTTAAPASTTAAKPATKPMSTTVTTKTSVAKKGTRR